MGAGFGGFEREEKERSAILASNFAETVGISATFLSKIETGEFAPPAPERIKKIAELVEVDADELLALANKVDLDLSEIIREQPKAIADFLRTARDLNLSEEEIQKLTERLRKKRTD